MLKLSSTKGRYELRLDSADGRTSLAVQMSDHRPVAFSFGSPSHARSLRLDTLKGALRSKWQGCAPAEQEYFDRMLELALRQVIIP